MSDTDDNSLQNDVITYIQNENTIISATVPHINTTNISGLSFRNNVLTSTMHNNMTNNFEWRRNGGSNFDQRSINRRETSPMSLRSVPNYKSYNFIHPTYQNGKNFQGPMYNGRGRSPSSVRSNDTMVSLASAVDIATALKNMKCNNNEARIIKEAYNYFMKNRRRKRIEKRRNLKLFLKRTRRKSDENYGELSDSSESSNDGRSRITTNTKGIIPRIRHDFRDDFYFTTKMRDDPQLISDACHISTNIRKNPMFTDCTEIIKQQTTRKMFSNSIPNNIAEMRIQNTHSDDNDQNMSSVKTNSSIMTQKERFTKGFPLPSQRFNNSVSGQTQMNDKNKQNQSKPNQPIPAVHENDSDQENIFEKESVCQKTTVQDKNIQKKRTLDIEDVFHSDKKRNKLDLLKNTQISAATIPAYTKIQNNQSNDFNFLKPKIPIKKGKVNKDISPEKLLGKSKVLPTTAKKSVSCEENNKSSPVDVEINKDIADGMEPNILQNTNDVSMRPSFIKRKLFTQKLDVAENKNISCDSIGANSPQNIYSASMRERSKARKLVTSQSCLSREVQGDDNIVIDLIHKIVPAEHLNVTNTAHKSNDIENSEKWDVTSVIANCDNQDISDTYTDEDIFNSNYDKNVEKNFGQKENFARNSKKGSQRKDSVKLNSETVTVNKSTENNNNKLHQSQLMNKESIKKTVDDCMKTFWDTDLESDLEFNAPAKKTNVKKNQAPKVKPSMPKVPPCKVVMQKLNIGTEKVNKLIENSNNDMIPQSKLTSNDTKKKTVDACMKTFWDTDLESDLESSAPAWKSSGKQNQDFLHRNNKPVEGKVNSNKKKSPISKGTVLNFRNYHKQSKVNNTMISHRNPIVNGKEISETTEPNSVVMQSQESIIVGKTNQTTISQTGKKKKEIAIQNISANNKKEESSRERKPRKCVDCNTDKLNISSNKINGCRNEIKKDEGILNIEKHPVKTSQKPKDNKNITKCVSKVKQTNKDVSNRNMKSNQINNALPQKQIVNNIRIQPKRKSKDRSLIQATEPKKNVNNTNSITNSKTKFTKDLISKNITLNNSSSSMTTRSRGKLSLNCSGWDQSSMDLSDLSNRTLRLLQRSQRNIN